MTELPSKTDLSPDGAVVDDEGGFVLPDDITLDDLINAFVKSRPFYEKAFLCKEKK